MSESPRRELATIDRSIVLVIDLQGKLMDMIERPTMIIEATRRLLKLADLFGVPVLLSEQYPQGLGGTHPAIVEVFGDLTVEKRWLQKTAFGCCGDDAFAHRLRELRPELEPGQRQLIVAGIEAHVCVMQTVLEVLRRGDQVHLCWDCVSGRGEEYRREALRRMEGAGAVITNHESVGFEWARHKDHPAFKGMSSLFKGGQPS